VAINNNVADGAASGTRKMPGPFEVMQQASGSADLQGEAAALASRFLAPSVGSSMSGLTARGHATGVPSMVALGLLGAASEMSS